MGRKGFATNGKEHEGRLFYEDGISGAAYCFKAAYDSADPETLILSDSTYSEQEFQFCDPADKDAKTSLATAIQQFDDALLCHEAVKNTIGYKTADKTYQHDKDHRIQGCPVDAFHQCCKSHITRLRNSLRTPGINMIEKAVMNQRIANMKAAQAAYLKLQMSALA
jgi:hypothetical protein